jgi:glyceraldehyde 3-phosphate dehydrogenase
MTLIAGINGFGRVGLHLLKYVSDRQDSAAFAIGYINDDTLSLDDAFTILQNDEAVRFAEGSVRRVADGLEISWPNGAVQRIVYSTRPLGAIPWAGTPDLVFECSGKATKAVDCRAHLVGDTRLAVISATAPDADQTLIYGFNHEHFDPGSHILSYGSCTVNAYVPLAASLNRRYGIIESDVNIIHNTPRHRMAGAGTLTRRLCTLEHSGPKLLDFLAPERLTVNYTAVPYAGVSIIDFRFRLRNAPDRASFISTLATAIKDGDLAGLYGLETADRGPESYIGSIYSAVLVADHIRIVGDSVYLQGYFDTENSVNRLYDLVQYIATQTHFVAG